jgi:hypothetical protein
MTPYTLAMWRVKAGREDEFVEAWTTDLVRVAALCDDFSPGLFLEIASG